MEEKGMTVVIFGFSDFDFEAKFLIFLPLEPYLKIFVSVKEDITY
jgi:hypothetical protein